MSCISINLKKEETLVKIEDNATEEEIMDELKIKIAELTRLYQDEKTPIRFTGRILSEKELQDIKDLVEKYLDVKIVFDTPTSLGLHSIIRSYKEKIENSDTIFQRGSVRSGQKIEAKGTVVIIGDVNAGAKGNKDAIITAGNLEAVQVRISNIVKEIDKTENLNVNRAYICVKNDKIEIEKW